MANPSAMSLLQIPLPGPYADWRRLLQEAKSVLDGLTVHGFSTSRDSFAYGCVSFACDTISSVRRAYEVDHPRGEILCDLGQAHGLIRLASSLLEIDIDGMPPPPGSGNAADPVLIRTLCRSCSGCIGEMLKILPIEALQN